MGGVEQHRLHLRKRVGHLGRNAHPAKSPVNCLAKACNCPSSVCFLMEAKENEKYNLMVTFGPIANCRLARNETSCCLLNVFEVVCHCAYARIKVLQPRKWDVKTTMQPKWEVTA